MNAPTLTTKPPAIARNLGLLHVWDDLALRGISTAARHEGMRPTALYGAYGVRYVCRDIHGNATLGTDDQPLERWKRTSKSNDPDLPKDLYFKSGQKPTGSRPVMCSRDGVIPDADGRVIIVEGFADWLSLKEAGYPNALGIPGGSGVPDDISAQLGAVKASQAGMLVHNDDAGTRYAQQLIDNTAGSGIACTLYRLPSKDCDVNDLWKAADFDRDVFQGKLEALETFTLAPTPKQEYRPRKASLQNATPGRIKGYTRATFEGLASDLAKVTSGRNDALTALSARGGNLVSAGWATESDVIDYLLPVALAIGLREREALATIRSGIKTGLSTPAELPPLPDDATTYNLQPTTARITPVVDLHIVPAMLEAVPARDVMAMPLTDVFKRGLPYEAYAATGLTFGAAVKVALKLLVDAVSQGIVTEPFDPSEALETAADEAGIVVTKRTLHRWAKLTREAGFLAPCKKSDTELENNSTVRNFAFVTFGEFLALIHNHPELRRAYTMIYANAIYGELAKPDPMMFDGIEGTPDDPDVADFLNSAIPANTETKDAGKGYKKYCERLERCYHYPPFPLTLPEKAECWKVDNPADFDALVWHSFAATKQGNQPIRWKKLHLIGCTSSSTISDIRQRAGVVGDQNIQEIEIDPNSPDVIRATKQALRNDTRFAKNIEYVDHEGKKGYIVASDLSEKPDLLQRLRGAKKITVCAQTASTERVAVSEQPVKKSRKGTQENAPSAIEKPEIRGGEAHLATPRARAGIVSASRWARWVRAQLALALAIIELHKQNHAYTHTKDNRAIAAAYAHEQHRHKTSVELIALIRATQPDIMPTQDTVQDASQDVWVSTIYLAPRRRQTGQPMVHEPSLIDQMLQPVACAFPAEFNHI